MVKLEQTKIKKIIMKDLKKFNHTVNVLLKAYLNDTLEHGSCHACAVGNLVAEALHTEVCQVRGVWINGQMPYWNVVFITSDWNVVFITSDKKQYVNPENYVGTSKTQIDATGYTWQQLAKIEFAFETANPGRSNDEWMFNGLMAVVDVLAEIHEIDLETVKETKELFV